MPLGKFPGLQAEHPTLLTTCNKYKVKSCCFSHCISPECSCSADQGGRHSLFAATQPGCCAHTIRGPKRTTEGQQRENHLSSLTKKIIYTLQLQSKRNKAADGSKGSKGLCCRCWFQQAQWQEGSLSTLMLCKEGPETCESTAALLIRNNCPFSIWMRYLKSPHFEDT